jgi:hypothetical protein
MGRTSGAAGARWGVRAEVHPAKRPYIAPAKLVITTIPSSHANSFIGRGAAWACSSPASAWHLGHACGSSADSNAVWQELQRYCMGDKSRPRYARAVKPSVALPGSGVLAFVGALTKC